MVEPFRDGKDWKIRSQQIMVFLNIPIKGYSEVREEPPEGVTLL